MEDTLQLLKSINEDHIELGESKLYTAFDQIKTELAIKPELGREAGQILYLIQQFLVSKSFSDYILTLVKEHLKEAKEEEAFTKFLFRLLVDSSEILECQDLLCEILEGDNYVIKSYIFYHPAIGPIRKIFQTPECKKAIVSFVNSEKFKLLYDNRCKMPGYHSVLFAFPIQYQNCFDLRNFDPQAINNISPAKLSKLASRERLESIRLINDDYFKLELIKRYYTSYLPILYKTRFIRLVDKTFPELDLKKNGYSHCL